MDILICHHVEPCWAETLSNYRGVDFFDYQKSLFKFAKKQNYDKIILTRFEEYKIKLEERDEYKLYRLVDEVENYGYGWDKYCVEDELKQYNDDLICFWRTLKNGVMVDVILKLFGFQNGFMN